MMQDMIKQLSLRSKVVGESAVLQTSLDIFSLAFIKAGADLSADMVAKHDEKSKKIQAFYDDSVWELNELVAGKGCLGRFPGRRVEDAEKLYNDSTNKDVLINNTMLLGYVVMGDIESAWKLFSGMSERDVASWAGVIRCFMRYGQMDKTRELFEEMPKKDVVAWTVMIQGYLGNNQIIEAPKLFDEMPNRDVVAWNSMISGYVKNGNLNEALKLFNHIPKCNVVSWNTILQGTELNLTRLHPMIGESKDLLASEKKMENWWVVGLRKSSAGLLKAETTAAWVSLVKGSIP
nr:hypothetical protein [Tanacetum cinerariifolium]GEY96448.1 hypothetical protein [Tanacetum cinerariifolium]